MKKAHLISLTIVCLFSTACAQTTPSEREQRISQHASDISDHCKLYAAEAWERGMDFINSYGRCIDLSLQYLEARRLHNEQSLPATSSNESRSRNPLERAKRSVEKRIKKVVR